MKSLIKKIINEDAGVPTGISNSAKKIFDDLISSLKSSSNYEFDTSEEIQFVFDVDDGNYNFSDFEIKSLSCRINFDFSEYIDDLVIASLGVQHNNTISKDFRYLMSVSQNSVILSVTIGCPVDLKTIKKETLINFLQNKSSRLISSFAHELQHSYNKFKSPKQKIKNIAQYDIYSNLRVNDDTINNFLFNMYYMTRVEDLVRPSEIKTLMDEKKISKKNFINFFLNTNTYKKLKEISLFSFNEFIQELKNNMGKIETVLTRFSDVTNKTDDEKIDMFLSIVYKTLVFHMSNKVSEILSLNNPFTGIFMRREEIEARTEAFESIVNEINGYEKNPKKYFLDSFKRTQNNSQKIMKRISKIYSLNIN